MLSTWLTWCQTYLQNPQIENLNSAFKIASSSGVDGAGTSPSSLHPLCLVVLWLCPIAPTNTSSDLVSTCTWAPNPSNSYDPEVGGSMFSRAEGCKRYCCQHVESCCHGSTWTCGSCIADTCLCWSVKMDWAVKGAWTWWVTLLPNPAPPRPIPSSSSPASPPHSIHPLSVPPCVLPSFQPVPPTLPAYFSDLQSSASMREVSLASPLVVHYPCAPSAAIRLPQSSICLCNCLHMFCLQPACLGW